VKGAYPALNETSPFTELRRDVTCHIGSHSVTCHPTQVNAPRLNPSQYAGTRFTYPEGMEVCVDLDYPAMHRPGGSNSRPLDHKSDVLTTTQPSRHTTMHGISVTDKFHQIISTQQNAAKTPSRTTLPHGHQLRCAHQADENILRPWQYHVIGPACIFTQPPMRR